jgi:CheY-like chemotaxis protein
MRTKSAKKKLLIADDELTIRSMVKRIFEPEYVVIEAINGKEAIEQVLHHIPDIILMDVMMPGTDGLTALNAIRNNKYTSSIPVIMFTGAGYELNEALARSLGAVAYLRKPVTPQELRDGVTGITNSVS